MPTLRALPWTLAGILLLTVHLGIGAAESPQDTLRSTIGRLGIVLRDPALQGDSHRQERVEQVREILRAQFAFPEMAQQALGPRWRDRTEAEQGEFVRLFTALLEQAYSGILERYAAEVQVQFDQERIQGALAEVDTRVLSSAHEQPVAITYRLRDVGSMWLVYDVVIDRVSLVRNYGAQFSRILATSSFADLMQDLESKLRELQVAPVA
jgi:phospholipid transport system substrate-binding protein